MARGRFLCPAGRLEELAAAVPDDEPMRIGLILSADDQQAALDAVCGRASALLDETDGGLEIDAVEVAPAAEGVASVHVEDPGSVQRLYLEVPALALRSPEAVAAAVAGVAATRRAIRTVDVGAKLRCGGVRADLVPSPQLVAAFLAACVTQQVPFKATAGLHHPVRHHNAEAGWVMHGFLNVLGGGVLHAAGAVADDDLAELVADADPDAFALDADGLRWRGRAAGPDAIARARALVNGYGSCSFDEPVEDLLALGMLTVGRAA